jgi:23S rRNA pseudouridine1911/1915/1917 synthase
MTGGGEVDAPVGRHPRDRVRMAVVERGRQALTRYRVITRFRAQTHVRLELETGRTHQIRVHMAHIRHPVLGDPVYGGRPRLPKAPSEALIAALKGLRRQALHARGLAFSHPRTGTTLQLQSELPADFAHVVAALAADAEAARDSGSRRHD